MAVLILLLGLEAQYRVWSQSEESLVCNHELEGSYADLTVWQSDKEAVIV
jgi:hypothetical protein